MKQYRTLFGFLALMLAVSLACGIDFGTSTPATSEPSQTQPPVNNPPVNNPPVNNPPIEIATTGPSTDQPVSNGQFFTEDFNGDISSNWAQTVELNATEGDKGQANISVKDGYLVFDFGKWLIGYEFYQPNTYKNVRIDIRVDNRGTNVNNVLLVCRASDEGHYLVSIANSGLFAMYAFDGGKKTYSRMADGGSNKIKPGKETNDYALVCNEKKLTLFINGSEARSYTDNQFVFREGMVGIGVASENQIPVKLEFDWVKISQP
jgi:hypothetical protein